MSKEQEACLRTPAELERFRRHVARRAKDLARIERKRQSLDQVAEAMRAANLTRGKGCKSIARAIAERTEKS